MPCAAVTAGQLRVCGSLGLQHCVSGIKTVWRRICSSPGCAGKESILQQLDYFQGLQQYWAKQFSIRLAENMTTVGFEPTLFRTST